MPCYRPLYGYRAPGGSITFKRSESLGFRVAVACGQCLGCRLDRSRDWALRCIHEAQEHEHNAFVTLTYDDDHLPPTGSLNVKHWQDFAKRLRKNVGQFRFFHCGEYGRQTRRPHLHACIFGLDFHEDRTYYTTRNQHTLYTSPTLDKTWTHGYTYIGDLTIQSAAYVARYILKKRTGPDAQQHYEHTDPKTGEVHQLKPEYTTMSRKPGIGSNWIKRYIKDVYPHDYVVHNGRKYRTPHYYDQHYSANNDISQIKQNRLERTYRHAADLTPDRLETREKVHEARAALLVRPL